MLLSLSECISSGRLDDLMDCDSIDFMAGGPQLPPTGERSPSSCLVIPNISIPESKWVVAPEGGVRFVIGGGRV